MLANFIMDFGRIITILFLVIFGVLMCAVIYSTPITYYIVPSSTNLEFKPETRQILQTSLINTRYFIKETDNRDEADIVVELRSRDSLTKDHKKIEYYPGTNKQIRFSLTWQNPRPYIAIDDQNWTYGVPESNLSISDYRKYVIRHEFMHALGYDHQPCNSATAVNGVCPVLYQATRGAPRGFKCGTEVAPVDFTKKMPHPYITY